MSTARTPPRESDGFQNDCSCVDSVVGIGDAERGFGFSVTYESTSIDVGSFGRDLFEELVRENRPISASFGGFREHDRPAQLYCPDGYVWKLCDGLVLDSQGSREVGRGVGVEFAGRFR